MKTTLGASLSIIHGVPLDEEPGLGALTLAWVSARGDGPLCRSGSAGHASSRRVSPTLELPRAVGALEGRGLLADRMRHCQGLSRRRLDDEPAGVARVILRYWHGRWPACCALNFLDACRARVLAAGVFCIDPAARKTGSQKGFRGDPRRTGTQSRGQLVWRSWVIQVSLPSTCHRAGRKVSFRDRKCIWPATRCPGACCSCAKRSWY